MDARCCLSEKIKNFLPAHGRLVCCVNNLGDDMTMALATFLGQHRVSEEVGAANIAGL